MQEAVAEKLAHQQCRVRPARVLRAEHPAHERASDPRPLRPPGKRRGLTDRRPSHQRTLPVRLRPRAITGRSGHTGMYARLSGTRQARTRRQRRRVRGRPWKASGYTDRATAADAVRYMSVDAATRRSAALQADTRRDRQNGPPSARIRS